MNNGGDLYTSVGTHSEGDTGEWSTNQENKKWTAGQRASAIWRLC